MFPFSQNPYTSRRDNVGINIIASSAEERAKNSAEKRLEVRRIAAQNPTKPWSAEPDGTRLMRFQARNGKESIQGSTQDFQPVAFLSEGTCVSRAIALVVVNSTEKKAGTGFMISPALFITNHHVIDNVELAAGTTIEFGYEYDKTGRRQPSTRFTLDPKACFLTAEENDLDFTIVAVGPRLDGGSQLADFGYCPLSDRDDKHALGMPVNIVQHPEMLPKTIAIRNNLLTARIGRVLQYETDTEVGSSGSPVFNDSWDVIALHHWGQPYLERQSDDGKPLPANVNEGIRISQIIERLREELPKQNARTQELLQEALSFSASGNTADPKQLVIHDDVGNPVSVISAPESYPETEESIMNSDPTTVRIVVPLEISVRLGTPAGAPMAVVTASPKAAPPQGRAEAVVLDEDYSNRHGYDPQFIPGQTISIPQPKDPSIIAPLNGRGTRADAGEILYEHFSIKMHRDRRMALFTATNVDGKAYISIDRKTGEPSLNTEEAGDRWFPEPRIDDAFYIRQDFYSSWSTYFDRGHLTRRQDPNWGTADEAVRANADTFHFTNCTPQHFLFNQSTKYWQGVERFVLENGAVEHKKKLCVFQGPVLTGKYADADDVKVPFKFWKIVAWEGANGLKAAGFIVSQENLLSIPRKRVGRPASETKINIDEFRAHISEIESQTLLDFGELRTADTYEHKGEVGAEAMKLIEADKISPITSWADVL